MFKNGNRFVKWLLRIFPFILLFLSLIYFIVACKESFHLIVDSEGMDPLSYFWENYASFLNNVGDKFFEFNGLTQHIVDFLTSTMNIQSSILLSLDLIVSILVYELFLSFLFLIFDVFNFMLTICSKFLNKGEKLNE